MSYAAIHVSPGYRNSEGLEVVGRTMYVISKIYRMMYNLDLDSNRFCSESTFHGAFGGASDQIANFIGDNGQALLYFTEESDHGGLHARTADGSYFTIFESAIYREETTGVAFSPDKIHLYAAYQINGLLLDVTRKDGLPFTGEEVNMRYHYRPQMVNRNG